MFEVLWQALALTSPDFRVMCDKDEIRCLLGRFTRMYIRFPFWLMAVISLFVALSVQALTVVPSERPPGHHDWRVDSKDGTKSYGVAGDYSETYIWFGASPLRVRAPFYAVVAGLTLLPVGLAALICRIVRRRNENAA